MRERWLFDLTDREGAPVRRLENVVSASLVGNVNRQIRWDGRLELGAESGVDWAAVRVAVSYQRDNGAPEPFGVYVPMLDTQTRVEGGREQVSEIVNLYDRTSIPAGDLIADTYSLTAGDTVTSLVQEIIETTGERGVSITPLGERTRTDLVWDPGTSKLRIINDLLDAAGFLPCTRTTAASMCSNRTGCRRCARWWPPTCQAGGTCTRQPWKPRSQTGQ